MMRKNLKATIKKIALKNKFFSRKHSEYNIIYKNALVLLSEDSFWIYTLMKSGTTYTLLFLANYINYLSGNRNGVSFDEMQSKFILHSLDGKIKELNIEPYLKEFRKLRGTVVENRIIHTHEFFNSTLWHKNISLYRNPLDYIISRYYYFYINRGIKVSHPRSIYKELLDHFIITYKHQLDLKNNYPEKVLSIAYEELMKSPKEIFKNLISFMDLKMNDEGIEHAMKFSSKKEVKKMESERGEAIVKKEGINFKGSFVRSGKVGEWKSYFNDEDINNIRSYLAESGIDYDDFIYE